MLKKKAKFLVNTLPYFADEFANNLLRPYSSKQQNRVYLNAQSFVQNKNKEVCTDQFYGGTEAAYGYC